MDSTACSAYSEKMQDITKLEARVKAGEEALAIAYGKLEMQREGEEKMKEDLQTALAEAYNEITDLEKEKGKLMEELESHKEAIKAFEAQFYHMMDCWGAAEERAGKLERQNRDLKGEVVRMAEAFNTLKDRVQSVVGIVFPDQ